MSKCILLIDMDGVTCDWAGRLKEVFEAKFPTKKLVPFEKTTKFYVEDSNPPSWNEDIKKVSRTLGFYESLNPIPGAIESLKDIEANCLEFIEPFIVSSPEVHYDVQMCHSEKANWVERHLGHFWTKRLILSKDKTLVRGHILIDDKPEITGAMTPTWNQLVFAQPWNKEQQADVPFTWAAWPGFRDDVLRPNFGIGKGREESKKEDSRIILINN